MMDGINLYSIDYYKKTVFKGSYKGLCFRIGKMEIEPDAIDGAPGDVDGAVDGGSAEPVTVLRVQAWKGPYILEKTEEEVFTEQFEYSDEGLKAANEWLEDKQRELIV